MALSEPRTTLLLVTNKPEIFDYGRRKNFSTSTYVVPSLSGSLPDYDSALEASVRLRNRDRSASRAQKSR